MTITVLKNYFKKLESVIINYSDYKSFYGPFYGPTLMLRLEQFETISLKDFKSVFMDILNARPPMKQKVVRGNNAPFMNKTLSKEFMHMSRLKNRYHKNPTEEKRTAYKKPTEEKRTAYKKPTEENSLQKAYRREENSIQKAYRRE